MRILVSWLREFVDVTAEPAALADKLTMRGFEVASIEPPPAGPLSPRGEISALPDAVLDLELTANRPDCLSVIGIAREVATAFECPMTPAGVALAMHRPGDLTAGSSGGEGPRLKVRIEDVDRCPRYAAAVADVKIAPSPDWLANRLTAAGVRPISNVVDVTNYVMIELGHPLHAFDLARLAGATLRIRTARPGEQIRTLDGELRTLDADMLVIADANDAQALGGLMGGAASEVWGGTKTIAIESAYFKATTVRRTSKRLGLKTEASTRFERGADIEAVPVALARTLALLDQVGATQWGRDQEPPIDCYPSPRPRPSVSLRRARIGHLLGHDVADGTVTRVLTGLGFRPEEVSGGWQATVPSWRVDVSREVDLVEEVARHDGYERIPTTFPAQRTMPAPSDPRIERDALVRRVLAAAGFSEAQTFAFIETTAAAPFAEAADTVPIAHPLSEKFAVLRPSLLPGIVDAMAYNRRHGQDNVRLFEIGARFSGGSGEQRALAVGWIGAAAPLHWSAPTRPVDFFDMKGVIQRVAEALRAPARLAPATVPYLVPGRTAVVTIGEKVVGVVGQLAGRIADAREVPGGEDAYVAELDLDALAREQPTDVRAEPLPRHPSVIRDVSIVIGDTLPAEAVRGTIVAAAPPTLVDVTEFDRYQGKGIPEGQVSLSLHLTFRAADRTLTDAEVQQAMDDIVEALRAKHGAVRR